MANLHWACGSCKADLCIGCIRECAAGDDRPVACPSRTCPGRGAALRLQRVLPVEHQAALLKIQEQTPGFATPIVLDAAVHVPGDLPTGVHAPAHFQLPAAGVAVRDTIPAAPAMDRQRAAWECRMRDGDLLSAMKQADPKSLPAALAAVRACLAAPVLTVVNSARARCVT